MRSQQISLPVGEWNFAGRADFIILEGTYDANQLWLGFMDAVMFRSHQIDQRDVMYEKIAIKSGSPKHWKVINKRIEQPLSPGEAVHPYMPQVDVHQYILPIPEWQLLSDHMANVLRHTHFPAFDRDPAGRTYQCSYVGNRVAKASNKIKHEARAKEWLIEYCIGRVVLERTVTFEKHDDAILALTSGLFQRVKEPASKS